MRIRHTIPAIAATAMLLAPAAASAQSAVDGYALSRNDLRGTARFMSMGGAFGALGGDLSVLNYNPGGIGVYRSSEVGVTVDFDIQHATGSINGLSYNHNQTKVTCNNFGYIGSVSTGSDVLPYLTFGATYSRANSFHRQFGTPTYAMSNSYSNYIAGVTSANSDGYMGWSEGTLAQTRDYNPYIDSRAPFMSILSYNSYLINPDPTADAQPAYKGLWQNNVSTGSTYSHIIEEGYNDEYNISLGGNLADVVYWGMSFGITDMNYTRRALLVEDIDQARIPNVYATGVVTSGTFAGYDLNTYQHTTGNGFNYKIGLIIKPINEFRIGIAVHTPTYFNLTTANYASVDYDMTYDYRNGKPGSANSYRYNNYAETNDGYDQVTNWKLQTPWRLMVSAAGVLMNRMIISADYEYRPYQNISIRDDNNNKYEWMNSDVKDYYQTSNIIRLGAEYRISRNLSARAGFAYESTPTKLAARDGSIDIYTEGPVDAGTRPSFTMDNSTRYLTCGLGYRFHAFYADLAYVNKYYTSVFYPYTSNDFTGITPSTRIASSNHNIVVSLGFKF